MEFAFLGQRKRTAVGKGEPSADVRERIAVPRGARARQVGVERRTVVGEGVGDACVVRYAHGLPVAVVEIRLHVGARGLRADRATGRAWCLEEVAAHVVQPVDHRRDAELAHRGERLVAYEPPARVQLRARGCRLRLGRWRREQRKRHARHGRCERHFKHGVFHASHYITFYLPAADGILDRSTPFVRHGAKMV